MTKSKGIGRGGKRPGTGAPRGNLNALQHGERSTNWRELTRKYTKHPGRGKVKRKSSPGAPHGNLNALKTGAHSKIIEHLASFHPTVKAMRLSKDRARKYVVAQLKK